MSLFVDELIEKKEYLRSIEQCISEENFYMGIFLCTAWKYRNVNTETYDMIKILKNKICDKITRVRITCNWCDSSALCACWNKMSEDGNGKWSNIQLVSENPCDYLVVINKPLRNEDLIDNRKKTIVFRMEPNMENEKEKWGEWAKPNKGDFLFVGFHDEHFNNNEWHLSKTYTQLSTENIEKDSSLNFSLSTVLSSKYSDEGHIKRIDFAKYMEKTGVDIHVFGDNKFVWKNYKGSPEYHKKDEALLPYKYTFNAENQSIKGYYTEKLIDGILAECLVFYRGPPNIRTLVDERAYVSLNLSNFEHDCDIIKKSIENDLWKERLPYIKQVKHRILNETSFFPRLKRIIDEDKNE